MEPIDHGRTIGPAVVPGPLGRQTKKRCIIKDYRKTHLDAGRSCSTKFIDCIQLAIII